MTIPVHLRHCLSRAKVTEPGAAAAAAPVEDPMVNGLTVDQRFDLCRSIGEECITGKVTSARAAADHYHSTL